MKIVSYNINRYNQTKLDYVLAMNADIYVLPECADKTIVGKVPGYEMEWMGNYDIKGLAVLIREGIRYEVPSWWNKEHRYMIPVIIEDEFLLLASWPTLTPGVKKSYPQILLETLKEYEPHIRKMKTLICGDYNCYIGQTGVSKKTGTFEQCIEFLHGMGLDDLYHKQTDEEYGKETKATYHHLFKEDMPFFLDYAFTNIPMESFSLGDWNREISDHNPLVMELPKGVR